MFSRPDLDIGACQHTRATKLIHGPALGERLLNENHVSTVWPAPAADTWRLPSPTCTEPLHVILGQRLQRLRVERGMSRETLAARLRIPVAHVEGHESGTRLIRAHELIAYAKFFGVRVSSFFRDLS